MHLKLFFIYPFGLHYNSELILNVLLGWLGIQGDH